MTRLHRLAFSGTCAIRSVLPTRPCQTALDEEQQHGIVAIFSKPGHGLSLFSSGKRSSLGSSTSTSRRDMLIEFRQATRAAW